MGATKRAAELVLLDCARHHPRTSYTAVRFGNVLGSRGSVIPLFERQLEAGHPLTVTDPEVTRYFMTIPEAVQLVLKASLLPEARGRIAMLDMGEPVRIVDLVAGDAMRPRGFSLRVGGLHAGFARQRFDRQAFDALLALGGAAHHRGGHERRRQRVETRHRAAHQ